MNDAIFRWLSKIIDCVSLQLGVRQTLSNQNKKEVPVFGTSFLFCAIHRL
ncbi:hypothetical protein BSM4216_1432 [Bacillus smithii]|nr:hypothetical protein BSM4216_1432 [Bacillus smithii]